MGNIHTCGPNECVVISGQFFFVFIKYSVSFDKKMYCVLDGQIIITFIDKRELVGNTEPESVEKVFI